MVGRKKLYTEKGISRVPCIRCGATSTGQWSICSLDGRYVACCLECDIGINALVLQYMRVPGADVLLEKYKKSRRGLKKC